ncbi:MAG: sugar ABC transporter permease [Anaerolineae bacterium]|nr:sugar ABC transporter permease [Anaerolineae bacterium]
MDTYPLTRRERIAQYLARNRRAVEAWLILTPILIYYFVFAVFPVLANLSVSFLDWNGFNEPAWAGLANYERFFTNPRYQQVLLMTVFFAVAILIVNTVLGFFIALALNEQVKGLGIYRTLWYVPTLTSAAVMAQIATVFIAPRVGVTSVVLASLGLESPIWQTNIDFARLIIVVFSVWRSVGTAMLLFLAGLQSIPLDVIDAARVDGAAGWRMLRHITLPLLRPMTVFVLVTGLIAAFQVFEPVYLITNGKSGTNVMMLKIYDDAFQNGRFGMAAAMATVMLVVLLWASFLNLRLMGQTSAEQQ